MCTPTQQSMIDFLQKEIGLNEADARRVASSPTFRVACVNTTRASILQTAVRGIVRHIGGEEARLCLRSNPACPLRWDTIKERAQLLVDVGMSNKDAWHTILLCEPAWKGRKGQSLLQMRIGHIRRVLRGDGQRTAAFILENPECLNLSVKILKAKEPCSKETLLTPTLLHDHFFNSSTANATE